MEPEDSRDFQEIIGDPKMSQMWDQQSLRESRKKSRESIPNLFVAGGIVRTASSECEAYNPNTGEWTRIPPMREERNACGAAAVGNLLYVIGGANKVSDLPSGECYSPLFNNWHDITPMNHGRRNFGICSNNDTIYLMGGMTGEQCLQSAIKFNTVLGAWHSCPTLREALNPCRTVALNNVLYAFGGFKCPSVEKWDLRTPAWVMLAGQPKVIEWYGVAAIDYVLYCIARDEQELRYSIRKYDTRMNTWESITYLPRNRLVFEVVAMSNKLFILGGMNYQSVTDRFDPRNCAVDIVDVYDPVNDAWSDTRGMLNARYAFGAAVLDTSLLREQSESLSVIHSRPYSTIEEEDRPRIIPFCETRRCFE